MRINSFLCPAKYKGESTKVLPLSLLALFSCLSCTSESIGASYPGPAQILSRSHGEKSGEGLRSKLRHGPEMVDSVSTYRGLGLY